MILHLSRWMENIKYTRRDVNKKWVKCGHQAYPTGQAYSTVIQYSPAVHNNVNEPARTAKPLTTPANAAAVSGESAVAPPGKFGFSFVPAPLV